MPALSRQAEDGQVLAEEVEAVSNTLKRVKRCQVLCSLRITVGAKPADKAGGPTGPAAHKVN